MLPGTRRGWLTALAAGLPLTFGGGMVIAQRMNATPPIGPFPQRDLRGRVVVVTGGTSGIGRSTASRLVQRGAIVVIGSRDAARGSATAKALEAAASNSGGVTGSVVVLPLDVSSPASTVAFADAVSLLDEVAQRNGGGIDALLLGAAEIPMDEGCTTDEGVDLAFATNHLGAHTLLTMLEPALRRGGQRERGRNSRVVVISSRLENHAVPSLDELESSAGARFVALREAKPKDVAAGDSNVDDTKPAKFDPMLTYAATKRCNMALVLERHARWSKEGTPIEIVAVTPGMVNTDLWRHYSKWFRALTSPVRAAFLRTAEDASEGVFFALAARTLPTRPPVVLASKRASKEERRAQAEAVLAAAKERKVDDAARQKEEEKMKQRNNGNGNCFFGFRVPLLYLSDSVVIEPSEGSRDLKFAMRLSELCDAIVLRTTGR